MRGGQRLDDDGAEARFALWAPRRPNALVHRVKEFEAESVFLRRPFHEFARAEDDGADPMAFGLLPPVDKQQSGLEDAPQLGPALERAPDFEPVGHDDDGLVLESGEQLAANAFLFEGIILALRLVRLIAVDDGAIVGRHAADVGRGHRRGRGRAAALHRGRLKEKMRRNKMRSFFVTLFYVVARCFLYLGVGRVYPVGVFAVRTARLLQSYQLIETFDAFFGVFRHFFNDSLSTMWRKSKESYVCGRPTDRSTQLEQPTCFLNRPQ